MVGFPTYDDLTDRERFDFVKEELEKGQVEKWETDIIVKGLQKTVKQLTWRAKGDVIKELNFFASEVWKWALGFCSVTCGIFVEQ